MLCLKRMDHLRVVGSAFLIHGQVVYCGYDSHVEETYKGPCMLPPSPALYICGTDIKVRQRSRHQSLDCVSCSVLGCCPELCKVALQS